MMTRLWIPTLLGLLAGGLTATGPGQETRPPAGFHLELSMTTLSGAAAIEVRIRNDGAKPALVNKRFAYAGAGNPVAELTFEGQPQSSTGCRFNLRYADSTDYTMVGPGQFVGRTFRATVASCFVGIADTVKLRARYLDHSQRDRRGPVLGTALVSNEITISREALREVEPN